MSIYATLWQLRFPTDGYNSDLSGWTEVIAQGVPSHIGSPTPDSATGGDPYAAFLPPLVEYSFNDFRLRAVVFVRDGAVKGTERSGHEYADPLLIMTGKDYQLTPFPTLHRRLCDVLRGDRAPVVAMCNSSPGKTLVIYANGDAREVDRE